MKKIVFLISSMRSGGAEKVIASLANYLCKYYDLTILMIATNDQDSFYELTNNVKLISLYASTEKITHGFKRILKLHKVLKTLKADYLIAFLPEVILYTFLSKPTKSKLIVSERNDPSSYPFLKRIALRFAFLFASKRIFQTQEASNFYNLRRSFIVPNPVFIYHAPYNAKTDVKNKVVLYVGRFDKQKNVFMAIKAFNLFRMKNPDFVMHMYGDGVDLPKALEFLKESNLENVYYCGLSNNWHNAEFSSALFLSSSNFEGMPNSLAEAACLGITCIATDCPVGGSKFLASIFKNIHLCPLDDYIKMEEMMEAYKNEITVVQKNPLSIDFIGAKWRKIIDE